MEILNLIVKENLIKKYDDWIDFAEKQEIEGMYCIKQIIETNGREKLSNELITKDMIVDVNELSYKKLDYEKSQKYFRNKKMKSNYNENFGKNLKNNFTTNLLKVCKLSEFSYSPWLRNEVSKIIDDWRLLEENNDILDAVLACLRSLHVRFLANENFKTETRDKFC